MGSFGRWMVAGHWVWAAVHFGQAFFGQWLVTLCWMIIVGAWPGPARDCLPWMNRWPSDGLVGRSNCFWPWVWYSLVDKNGIEGLLLCCVRCGNRNTPCVGAGSILHTALVGVHLSGAAYIAHITQRPVPLMTFQVMFHLAIAI